MPTLILVRHGESTWNFENKFTGEVDVDLTPLGEQEARLAGTFLRYYKIDIAYTSELKRAIHTLQIILKETGMQIPVIRSCALNERNYGDLQGMNKIETEKKYSVDRVKIWRRSYDTAPPNGESLKNTYDRVVPYYKASIEPQLKANKNVLIVGHGNALRALMMYLDNFSTTEISEVNIQTGIPRIYKFTPKLKLLNVNYMN
ncbi:MAG: 2,3-bisphosphoglycerate-dependent phosphoglycerate mutase [Ferruginibacter sp.]